MNPPVQEKIYRFANLAVSQERQVLLRGKETIHISTKLYHLLLALVENPGRIMSKDALINAAWHGQIVTDGTLSRAITRLRQLIDDKDAINPIIETHRGMGYRFALPVKVEERDLVPAREKRREKRREKPSTHTVARRAGWIFVTLSLLMVLAYSLLDKKTAPPRQTQVSMAVNLAVFATAEQQDWLNQGGKAFLVEALRKHPLIHAVQPTLPDHLEDKPELLAIRLSANSRVDYSSLIAFDKTTEGYSAHLSLRDENGILASSDLQASDLAGLIQASSHWIISKLEVHDELSKAALASSGSTDEYTLRSYFQGIYEVESGGNLHRARDFFEAAINQDPEFQHAWSRLAATLLALGQYDKAIAIANTQLAASNVEPVLRIQFNRILAEAWDRLRNKSKAQKAVAQAVNAINDTEDPYVRLEGLNALIFQSVLKEDYDLSEKYIRQAVEITRHYLPLPNRLASLYEKLGAVQRGRKEFDSAMSSLGKALEIYKREGNYNGVVSTYCQMNSIRYVLDKMDEIVQTSLLIKSFLRDAGDRYGKACFIQFTGMALNLRGYFARADEYKQILLKMARETGNDYFALLGGIMSIHQHYVRNELEASATEIDDLTELFKDKVKLPSEHIGFASLVILVSSRVDPVDIARKKINDYLTAYPQAMESTKAALNVSRALGHITVRSGHISEGIQQLEKAEKKHRDNFEFSVANYIGMEILEILIDHPELEYKATLNRLELEMGYYYLFYKLKAGFLAREGHYRQAALLMEENKLRANEFWSEKDQLLLEQYKRGFQGLLKTSSQKP